MGQWLDGKVAGWDSGYMINGLIGQEVDRIMVI